MKREELNIGVFASLSAISLLLVSLVFIFPEYSYDAVQGMSFYSLDGMGAE